MVRMHPVGVTRILPVVLSLDEVLRLIKAAGAALRASVEDQTHATACGWQVARSDESTKSSYLTDALKADMPQARALVRTARAKSLILRLPVDAACRARRKQPASC